MPFRGVLSGFFLGVLVEAVENELRGVAVVGAFKVLVGFAGAASTGHLWGFTLEGLCP